jgi:hypothetical protein
MRRRTKRKRRNSVRLDRVVLILKSSSTLIYLALENNIMVTMMKKTKYMTKEAATFYDEVNDDSMYKLLICPLKPELFEIIKAVS